MARRQLTSAIPLLVLGGSRLAAALIASLAMLVAARDAGPVVIGVWSMALCLQGYALQLAEFGLRSVATTEAIRTRGGATALLRRYLVMRLLLSVAVISAGLGVTAIVQPAHSLLMAVVLLSLIPAGLQLDWMALVEGRHLAASLSLLARPAVFLLALMSMSSGLTPTAIALAFLLSWVAAAVVSLPSCRGMIRVQGEAAPPSAEAMLRSGIGFAAVSLLAQLQLGADLLVVGWFLGAETAGAYYLASAVAVAGTVLANAAGQLALARMASLRNSPAGFRASARRLCVAGIGLGLLITVPITALAPPLLVRFVGESFAPAATLLLWLAPWTALVHLTTPLQAALGAVGQQRSVLRANIAMAAVLLPVLGLAAWLAAPWAFAVARLLAELTRLAFLIHAAGLITTGNASSPGSRSRIVRFSGAG